MTEHELHEEVHGLIQQPYIINTDNRTGIRYLFLKYTASRGFGLHESKSVVSDRLIEMLEDIKRMADETITRVKINSTEPRSFAATTPFKAREVDGELWVDAETYKKLSEVMWGLSTLWSECRGPLTFDGMPVIYKPELDR